MRDSLRFSTAALWLRWASERPELSEDDRLEVEGTARWCEERADEAERLRVALDAELSNLKLQANDHAAADTGTAPDLDTVLDAVLPADMAAALREQNRVFDDEAAERSRAVLDAALAIAKHKENARAAAKAAKLIASGADALDNSDSEQP